MEGVDAISEVAEENNEFLKTDHSPRSLDFARNSTIDLSALNNKIVNMRSSVRQAKVRVIHKLTRNIEMLKKKKGSEKQLDKLKSKSERLLKEIKMIKGVNLDKVSKYALWNTSTLEDICKQPSSSIETRALTRLAECSIIQEKVKMFRSSHSDWKSLAAYLVMKQSGRRYKKKKNRDKKSSHAETTNIKTRHIMTDTYLQEKLDKNKMSSNCTENSELFCDRETEIEELVGDGCVVPEESVINISKKDMVSVENKKDKMNSNKSLTNRLLKFFPDKTEDSDSSDCEANTISVHPKNKPADTAIENLNKDTVSEQSQIIVTDSVDCKTNDQLSSGKISTQMSNSGNKDYINQHNMERKKIAELSEKIENTESLCSESEDEETSEHSASEVSEYLNAEKNQNTNSLAEVKRQKGNKRTYGNKNELADTKSNKMTQLSYKDETNQDGKVKLTENKTDIVSSAEIEESEMSSEMSEQSEEEEDMSELCVRKQQMKNKASENEAKPWSVDTVSKEMVIKKLNLETFSSSAEGDILDIDETPPDFLISTEEVTHAKKRKKDPFFECSDDEEDDNDVNKSVVTEISGEVDDNDLSHLQHLQKARHAFKSDFVDKLGSKGYRRYDWSKNKMMQGDRMSTHRKSGSIARGGKRYENQNNKNYKGSERGFSDRDEDNTAKPWGKQKTFHKGGHDYSQSYELKTGVNKGQREFSKQSNNEVLHPSWEASKKRKQQVSIHAYQGKKIKFDD